MSTRSRRFLALRILLIYLVLCVPAKLVQSLWVPDMPVPVILFSPVLVVFFCLMSFISGVLGLMVFGFLAAAVEIALEELNV